MNSLFIYICVKPTVFQLLYGSYPPILAIDSSKKANNTRKTESVKNRIVWSKLKLTNTYGTPKNLPKYEYVKQKFIDLMQLESIFYHVLVIFNNCFREQKFLEFSARSNNYHPRRSNRFYLAQTLIKTQNHI